MSVTPETIAASPKRLPVLLRRAWFGLNKAFRERIEHLGLTPNQFTVLRWLKEGPAEGLSQRTLVDLMASDANTISSILSRMEKSGLIKRATYQKDRRASRVQLLAAGRAKFEKAHPLSLRHQERVLSALTPRRRVEFLSELERLANACAALSPPE